MEHLIVDMDHLYLNDSFSRCKLAKSQRDDQYYLLTETRKPTQIYNSSLSHFQSSLDKYK